MKKIIKQHYIKTPKEEIAYWIQDNGFSDKGTFRYMIKHQIDDANVKNVEWHDARHLAYDAYNKIIAEWQAKPAVTVTEIINHVWADNQIEQQTWEMKTTGVDISAVEAEPEPKAKIYPSYLRHHVVTTENINRNCWLEEIEQPDGTFKYASKHQDEGGADEVCIRFGDRDYALNYYDRMIEGWKSLPNAKVEVGYYHHEEPEPKNTRPEEDKDAVIAGLKEQIDDLVNESKRLQSSVEFLQGLNVKAYKRLEDADETINGLRDNIQGLATVRDGLQLAREDYRELGAFWEEKARKRSILFCDQKARADKLEELLNAKD